MTFRFLCIGLCTIFLSACENGPNKSAETRQSGSELSGRKKIYKGNLRIAADTGLESVVKQELEIFTFMHDSVNVQYEFKSDAELIRDFKTAKSSTIILTRQLDDYEIASFKRDTIFPRQVKVAYDAVAIIGNRNYDDKTLSLETLRNIFDPNQKSNSTAVFDSKNKSVVAHVLKVLGYSNKVSSSVYAAKSPDEVIDYVEKNSSSIGFIPYNMVSDSDDEQVKNILKRVKILSLNAKNEEGKPVKVSANQSDIATGIYPLTRMVNAVTRFTYSDGLDWLLINFMYQSRGAKIFLKAGLVPAKMPEREINVNTEALKTN